MPPPPSGVRGNAMRILWLADALRAQPGLKVQEVSGWKTRGRESSFSPRSAMFHHTASARSGGNAPALGIVTNGRSDLPGPLAHVLVGRDGTAHVVASGRANHAGTGGPWRDIPANQGNSFMVGVEVENDGVGEPWSATVLDACDRVFAAILKRLGRDASWLVGHKEYTSRKIDPNGVHMGAYRNRLQSFMEGDDLPDLSRAQQRALANFIDELLRPEDMNNAKGTAARIVKTIRGFDAVVEGLEASAHGGAGKRVARATRIVEGQEDQPPPTPDPSGDVKPHTHDAEDVPHEHVVAGRTSPPETPR